MKYFLLLLLFVCSCLGQSVNSRPFPATVIVTYDTATNMTVGGNLLLSTPKWVDVPVNYAYSVTGPSAPTLTATTSNALISVLGFDNGDILYGIAQMPHNLAVTNSAFPNFYIQPHVHFSVDKYIDNTHTNVTWTMVWQWADENGNFTTLQGTNTVTTGIGTDAGAKHVIASLGYITNNAAGITGIFRCRLTRPASVAQDYSNAHDVFLNALDLHVPIGNSVIIGSRQIGTQ